jgi:hypothetical protein
MNTKFKNMMMSVAVVLALGANSAWAVSPTTEWVLSRAVAAGSFFAKMDSSATSFCYLSEVQSKESGHSTDCRVFRGASNWSLIATIGGGGNASVSCRAYCYTR